MPRRRGAGKFYSYSMFCFVFVSIITSYERLMPIVSFHHGSEENEAVRVGGHGISCCGIDAPTLPPQSHLPMGWILKVNPVSLGEKLVVLLCGLCG